MTKIKSSLSFFTYAALAIIAVISIWILFRPKTPEASFVRVQKGDFQEILFNDGTVRSETKINVVAFADGDLDRVELKVGDTVKRNQNIAVLRWDNVKQINSPIDGVVSKVLRESAGPIRRGEVIVEIIDPNKLEVVVEVLTTDAVRIKLDTLAIIEGLSPNKEYQAKVKSISRAGFIKISALGIEEEKTNVYLQFLTPPPTNIGDNFHVGVKFILSEESDVLTVPLGALFKNQKSWAVFKIEKNRAHLQKVEITKKSDTAAIISSGVQEGDNVIVFPTDAITDGVKIKPVPVE